MTPISYIITKIYKTLRKTEGQVFVNYPKVLSSFDSKEDKERMRQPFFSGGTMAIYLRNCPIIESSGLIQLINHEFIHYLLFKRISYDACVKFDKILWRVQIDYNLI